MRFRNKPRIVEAEQFTEDHTPSGVKESAVGPFVTTAQGQNVPVSFGEWIIKESQGDGYYPCKNDIFQATYELVVEGIKVPCPEIVLT